MKLLTILYLIPWAFLGLYGDIEWNTVWLYLAAVLVPVALGWYLGKHGQIKPAFAGNLLGGTASVICLFAQQTGHWDAYFKPFGSLGILLMLWSAALLIQGLIWRCWRKDNFIGIVLWISALLLLLSPRLGLLLAYI